MSENKISTYLLYAIGEIVLVVIGILIAVSIDDWNNELKAIESRNEYLVALKVEFQENQKRLNVVRQTNQRNIDAARTLSLMMGEDPKNIPIDSIYNLIFAAIGNEVQYNPASGVIEDIITSGKLALFKNDSLRYLLAAWNSDLTRIQFQEKEEVSLVRSNLQKEVQLVMNGKNAFYQYSNNVFNLTPSKLKSNDFQILQSLYVENQLVGLIGSSEFLEMRYRAIEKKILEILQKIEKEQRQN